MVEVSVDSLRWLWLWVCFNILSSMIWVWFGLLVLIILLRDLIYFWVFLGLMLGRVVGSLLRIGLCFLCGIMLGFFLLIVMYNWWYYWWWFKVVVWGFVVNLLCCFMEEKLFGSIVNYFSVLFFEFVCYLLLFLCLRYYFIRLIEVLLREV